jgi:hypothetical protein
LKFKPAAFFAPQPQHPLACAHLVALRESFVAGRAEYLDSVTRSQ